MTNILVISNWFQLVKARAEAYPNLRIVVTEYNSKKLVGTKIKIVDYDTNDVYFTGFATDLQSTVIPTTALMTNDEIVRIINSYGFNVVLSVPTVLAENVVTMLKGLYAGGYRYVYRDYIPCVPLSMNKMGVFVSENVSQRYTDPDISKTPGFIADEWEWCRAFTLYPIEDLIETGTVPNGIPIQ